MPVNLNQPSYQRLRVEHAERRRPIAFWVGAGLSQPAGLPNWPGLRQTLLERALEQAATLPPTEGTEKEAALEQAASAASLWDSFQILKNEMGRTEFREEIRDILGHAFEADIPETYRAIWSLPGVRGMLTLNLDEFAGRSHKRTRLAEDAAVFVGRQAADYAHILSAGRPFIANLHGVMDAQSSWVFTRDEISQLISTSGYKEFISFVFCQMTVVFCGISAEDSAAGGLLEGLTNAGLDLGRHYWITHRADAATHRWAANAGLAVIRYTPESRGSGPEDHTSPLLELFADLRSYVSTDVSVSPLIPAVTTITSLPPCRELLSREADELRTLLSGYAKNLLEVENHDSTSNYTAFLHEYAPCIHQAWWLTSDEPYNRFYGHIIERQISSSPFSTVWCLRAPDSSQLALKVLRIENLSSGAEIDSFRRGIQSLEYLTRADVPGTPKLFAAFEMPTSLIMEFVEGGSLQELGASRTFDPWRDGIPIIESVCRHLRYGHNLPQGVLHRDVRPSNIMLPYFHWQPDFLEETPDKYDVKLLNYDMSWHANAKGQTIAGNIEESGYYAPELLSQESGRSTLVDSFGVGMCIYYAFTRSRPPAGGSKSTDWVELLNSGFRFNPRLSWRSAPMRMRRLVARATSPAAEDRPMIDQIGAELGLVRQAVSGAIQELPADFWAEELIAQSEQAEYDTDPSGTVFSREPRPGRKISISGDARGRKVVLSFRNQALASTNRSGLDRLWSEKLQSARNILSSSGWSVKDDTRYGNMEMLLVAECSLDELKKMFGNITAGLKRGLDQIRVE
jgi:serine/threonine protein kinase